MNTRLLSVVVGVLFVFNTSSLFARIGDVSNLAGRFASDFVKKKGQVVIKKRVAVLDFENSSPSLKEYNVGAAISAELSKALAHSTIFLLVEREKVSDLMGEIELGMTGAVDPGTSVKAGNILGAEFLVLGTVSEIGDKVIVNSRMIAAESGEVISVQQVSLSSEEVMVQSKEYYFSAFQSKYGISVMVNMMMLFPTDGGANENMISAQSLDVVYRLSKNFRFGVGYMFIGGNEIRRDRQLMTTTDYPALAPSYGDTDIWRNYNFSGSGPKFMADYVWPVFRWLNAVFRLEYIPVFDNSLEQDIAGFPVWSPNDSGTMTLQDRRLLVNSWATEKYIPHLFNAIVKVEFLISKRVSIDLKGGYCYATEYTPEIYEAGGNRQWMESIDKNGTFAEYHNFNFARDKNGDRVSFNFSGFTAGFGIAIHF